VTWHDPLPHLVAGLSGSFILGFMAATFNGVLVRLMAGLPTASSRPEARLPGPAESSWTLQVRFNRPQSRSNY
jgi:hypothetical protein